MIGLRRLRHVMRSLRQRERKGRAWPPILAGVLVAAFIGELALGENGMRAIAAAIKDPSSIISARSPGERSPGAKFSTKGASRSARALSTTTPVIPPEPGTPAAFMAQPDPVPDGVLPEEPAVPAAFAATPVPPDPVAEALGPGPYLGPNIPLSIIPGVPGGGDSGGDPGDDTPPPPPPPPPPPVPAVPEPASWFMLIAGFLTMGALLRRREGGIAVVSQVRHRW